MKKYVAYLVGPNACVIPFAFPVIWSRVGRTLFPTIRVTPEYLELFVKFLVTIAVTFIRTHQITALTLRHVFHSSFSEGR